MVSMSRLITLVNEIQPTCVAMPDVLGNSKLTRYLHETFCDLWSERLTSERTELMWILQDAENTLTSAMEQYVKIPCGIRYIGFPRCLSDNAGVFRRADIARTLERLGLWRKDVHHHLLGMMDGSLDEIRAAAPWFETFDNTRCFWRGAQHSGQFNVDAQDRGLSAYGVRAIKDYDEACKSMLVKP